MIRSRSDFSQAKQSLTRNRVQDLSHSIGGGPDIQEAEDQDLLDLSMPDNLLSNLDHSDN